jgi:polyisoprenyl-teichoic acid--peptidoglycan teichoic acid transferase
VSVSSTIRDPDQHGSPQLRVRRAWWLVGLGILIPGSPQLLAGSHRLGRFGVASTLVFWVLGIITLVLYGAARPAFLAIATNPVALFAVQLVLAFYAVLWVVLGLDTLRIIRLVRLPAAARIAVATLAVAAIVVTAGGIGYAATVTNAARGLLDTVFSGGSIVPPIDGRYNILLLGGDAGPDRVGLRPDSISVASIDAATGAATMIGIPRNLEQVRFSEGSPLWQDFPNGYDCGDECLISFLYTYGEEHPDLYPDAVANGSNPGIEAMRDAAEAVTGLQLQYYVLIDMQGFSELIDALGGIDISVAEKITLGKNGDAPIGSIAAGAQHMDGYTALWYARSRYNTTDYARMERQRQVQEAMLLQFEPANVLTKFQAVADAGAQVVSTDVPQGMLAAFVDLAGKTRSQPVTAVELTPDSGIVTAHPDYDLIHSLVQAALVVPTASPTP